MNGTHRLAPLPPAPPTAGPTQNVHAIIALVAGVAAFLVLPPLLGLIAIACGLVGERNARKHDAPLGKMAISGLILGLIAFGAALAA